LGTDDVQEPARAQPAASLGIRAPAALTARRAALPA
jgi:hypothetical protein